MFAEWVHAEAPAPESLDAATERLLVDLVEMLARQS
jgi:hypothetical protein